MKEGIFELKKLEEENLKAVINLMDLMVSYTFRREKAKRRKVSDLMKNLLKLSVEEDIYYDKSDYGENFEEDNKLSKKKVPSRTKISEDKRSLKRQRNKQTMIFLGRGLEEMLGNIYLTKLLTLSKQCDKLYKTLCTTRKIEINFANVSYPVSVLSMFMINILPTTHEDDNL